MLTNFHNRTILNFQLHTMQFFDLAIWKMEKDAESEITLKLPINRNFISVK